MLTWRARFSLSAAAVVLLGFGCASSREEVRAEFDKVVARSNACESADECAIVSPGCPLGCFVAVNSARQAHVEEAAEELIADYERGGVSCEYDCAIVGALVCTDGRCGFEPAREPSSAPDPDDPHP